MKLLSNLLFQKKNRKVRFKPGERVRVKSFEEIKKTLDENNRCESLLFMEGMEKFCGGDHEVLREVKWFYDEYRKKMLRCKDIVVLEDLVCDGKGILDGKDCDRSCLYFWKKTWLEKT